MKTKEIKSHVLVKKVCKLGSDDDIRSLINQFKQTPFIGLFDTGKTWFTVHEKYFVKYLKKFGRMDLSHYL
jgi:hypothetical protein